MRFKKNYCILLLISIILFSGRLGNVKAVNNTYEIAGPWTISSDQVFILDTFNIEDDIIIDPNVNVEFYACTFNFLSTTDVDSITLGNLCNFTMVGCTVNGLESVANGNGHIYATANPEKVEIINTEFNYFGSTEKYSAINLYGAINPLFSVLVEGCTFIGRHTGISIHGSSNTIIRNNIIQSSYGMSSYSGINFDEGKNVLVENNTITGFNEGIYITRMDENVTIIYNNVQNQTDHSITSGSNNNIGNAMGLNISSNVLNSMYASLNLGVTPNCIVMNNTIYSKRLGLKLDGGSEIYDVNKTISNNSFLKFPDDNIHKFDFITFKGIIKKCAFENNSITLPVDGENFRLFNTIDIDIIEEFNASNTNLVNNIPYYIFAGQNNTNHIEDFSNIDSISGLSIVNVTGYTFQNLSLDLLSINTALSNDLVFKNISITNQMEKMSFWKCNNVTIFNTTAVNNLSEYKFGIYISFSNNFTLDNVKVCNYGINRLQDGISISYSTNASIINSSVLGNIFNGFYLNKFNGSLMMDNYVDSNRPFDLEECYYNNLTRNHFNSISEPYVTDIDSADNNTFNGNHWYKYIEALDSNEDGFADNPYNFTTNSYEPFNVTDYNPLFFDGDGDGIDDFQEAYYGSNPLLLDTDFDGLSDFDEIRGYESNPNHKDSDGDGIEDYEEIIIGVDGFITNPTNEDTDGDFFSDYEELLANTDPTNSNSFPGGHFDNGNTETSDPIEEKLENTFKIPGLEILIGIILAPFVIYIISSIKMKKKKQQKRVTENLHEVS